MSANIKPIYLFADSQLLFWHENDSPFLSILNEHISNPKAAYFGASNENNAAFFDIFVAAMEQIGITDCRMLYEMDAEELAYLQAAGVIMLSGGDTAIGWHYFKQKSLQEVIAKRYLNGAVLMGVSAGAIQLGQMGWSMRDDCGLKTFPTFQLVPYIVGVHEGPEWEELQAVLEQCEDKRNAIGIPKGGGAIIHPDLSVQPIKNPVTEINSQLEHNLLLPPKDVFAQQITLENDTLLLTQDGNVVH